jgi:hypothetical protein
MKFKTVNSENPSQRTPHLQGGANLSRERRKIKTKERKQTKKEKEKKKLSHLIYGLE